jgi:protein-tyrosine-phosphatase
MKNNTMNKILFVCGENAGRSQMAEALFNLYAKERKPDWLAESAGTVPADKINSDVVNAMAETGLDLSGARTKKFEIAKIDEYAKIISFGCIVKSVLPKNVQPKIEECTSAIRTERQWMRSEGSETR